MIIPRKLLLRVMSVVLATGAAVIAGADLAAQEHITNPNGTEAIGTTDEGLLELHVRDLDLHTVLRMLSVQGRRNIITSPGIEGTVNAELHGVTFEEALEAILRSQGLKAVTDRNFVYIITQEQYDEMVGADRKLQARLFKLTYVTSTEAFQLITPMLSPDGKAAQTAAAEVGIASTPEAAGGDNLAIQDCIVVTDYPENLENIARVLRELDVRPRQVLIEATIMRAQLRDNNELGIDFNIVCGIDFEGINATSIGGTNLTLGPVPPEQFNNGLISTNTDFAGTVNAGGWTFGVIKNNIAVFIRALEQVTDATVMANPKVLALNKQRGEIIVGRRDGYLTTTVTETAAVQTVEFLETGTQLLFRPFIGDDGWVRMEIHPEDSSGGLTSANLPFEETTEVTANIMVRDGHTILIGGLFRERTNAGRAQVPGLGSIPGLGLLFQRINDESAREEVIILLTVHVIKDTPEEDAMFEGLAEDVERLRVGSRRRLLGIGRERLAQAHYKWAVEHLQQGDLSAALWDVNFALHNSTRMLPAIKLEERIRQQRMWDEEGTRMRDFVRKLIEGSGPDGPPYFDRPDVLHNPNLPGAAPAKESGEMGDEP
jgi:type IV pilus assembly protein PilQ